MNRRMFVAVGASAVAVASNATAAALTQRSESKAVRVTLSGWIRPGAGEAAHYFVFGPRAGVSDPCAGDCSQWPDDLTLVYPADAGAMRPGPARLEGWLHHGRFRDIVTGHASRSVLTEARLV